MPNILLIILDREFKLQYLSESIHIYALTWPDLLNIFLQELET